MATAAITTYSCYGWSLAAADAAAVAPHPAADACDDPPPLHAPAVMHSSTSSCGMRSFMWMGWSACADRMPPTCGEPW